MNEEILVIEDDPINLRLTKYTLEREGYHVLTATNGLEATRKAQQEQPALIILDVMLPGIDGFEVCHRLRSEPKTAKLPILMLSGKAREIDKATGLKAGADDYISKPWHHSELVAKVATMLKERARP